MHELDCGQSRVQTQIFRSSKELYLPSASSRVSARTSGTVATQKSGRRDRVGKWTLGRTGLASRHLLVFEVLVSRQAAGVSQQGVHDC